MINLRKIFFISFVLISKIVFAAPPELPREYLDTMYVTPTGNKITVSQGGDLQLAINNAQAGDIIEIEAGAVFTGSFELPEKIGTGWIYLQSSAYNSLPLPGKRATPENLSLMPKIRNTTSEPVFYTTARAKRYRLIGLEITTTREDAAFDVYDLVRFGTDSTNAEDLPADLIIDRCFIHGNVGASVRRGVTLNSRRSAVIDSYISEIHDADQDSQAIGGWSGPGPFKIVNNFLEAATENIIFGGSTPNISNLVPEDIEIRGNHLFKPLKWKATDPTYAGNDWSIKNSFELKNARRVLIEGNVFENNWADSQNGFAILFTVRGEVGIAPWSAVQDVTFQYNIIRNSDNGLNMSGYDDLGASQQTSRILIQHNFWDNVRGRLFQITNDPKGGSESVTINHNTSNTSGAQFIALGDTLNRPHTGFVVTNNITPGGEYGVFGSGQGSGTAALNAYSVWQFVKNVVSSVEASSYPSDNFYPTSFSEIGFVDINSKNYRLANSSSFKGRANDGTDPGADFDTLELKTKGVTDNSGDSGSPPVINLRIFDLKPRRVASSYRLDFKTTIAARCNILYGTTKKVRNLSWSPSASNSSKRTLKHRVRLTKISAKSRGYYRITCESAEGQKAKINTKKI